MGRDKKKNKQKKNPSKFAATAYNDDDYESYKPKMVASRRRQQTEETVLNEMFSNVIDACISFDTTKIFHYPVKRKDAPNYYDVIKQPVDLTSMKNKAKRGEYQDKYQFLDDIALLRKNAEFYNGVASNLA